MHGAADVHEQQHLDGVLAALRQTSSGGRRCRRLFDGLVEVELVGAPRARQLAEPPQGELDWRTPTSWSVR